jgi:hypothetical protein
MKTSRFLFAMLFMAASIPGAGLEYSFAQAAQQASSLQSEKNVSNAVTGGQKDTQSSSDKNQNDRNPDEKPTNSKGPSKTKLKHSSDANAAKPVVTRRQTQPANAPAVENLQPAAPASAPHFSQTGGSAIAPGKSAAAPNKMQPYRSTAPASAFSVNGEHFRNSRNPGARLATTGGPANSTHSTAAINGSEMKRKP